MKETPLFNALACGFMLCSMFPKAGILILLALGIAEVAYFQFAAPQPQGDCK